MFDIQKYVYGPTITIDGTKYRKMDIDKGTAELILENLYSGQRNRAESWATTIGRSMAAGQYKANNGQTIVFDEDGNLLDGQHRIEAIAKTGIEQTFLVAIVKADEADKQFQTIDNNRWFPRCENPLTRHCLPNVLHYPTRQWALEGTCS